MRWTLNNLDLIAELTLNHVRLSVIPILVSFLLSIPLGWLANRNKFLRAIVITGGSLLYTIPSLPLFVILPLIIPTRVLDETNLIVALSIYGVAIMARSASDALSSVSDTILDASSAIGYSPAARFFRVELPLAGPVLLAGIRVVSVSTIALVSVGVIIGSANLGYLFQNGKQRGILEEVVVGILISLLLALIFDIILVTIGRLLMPWNTGSAKRRTRISAVGMPAVVGRRDLRGWECPVNLFLDALRWIFDPANWVPGSQSPLPIQDRLIEHLAYTAIAIVIAALIALPLGFYIGHTGKGRQFVIAFTGSMRALPTLGLLFFLLMVFGYVVSYDRAPIIGATIAFVILAIPSMLAGAYSGLEAVDRQTIDAARANGMTEWQILTQVEIPLALPLIVGGVRASVLQVIATVTIASYAGLGGLGRIITSGIGLNDYDLILGGALLVTTLALARRRALRPGPTGNGHQGPD